MRYFANFLNFNSSITFGCDMPLAISDTANCIVGLSRLAYNAMPVKCRNFAVISSSRKSSASRTLLPMPFVAGRSEPLHKVDTLFNWSDIGTKALPAERLHSLVSQMPLKLVAMLTAVSAKAQGGQECRADDTGEWSTVLLVFGMLLALAFMCGRWSTTAWSPPEVQAIPSGGTHPTDDRPSLLMTRERGEWARATRGAPLAQQALTSATGEGSERSESGSVNPASGYELRGEILSRYSLDELKEIGRRLNVFCDDDKEAVVSHLRLAWYEGSIEVLAYLHEAMVRSCSRPNITDLLNSHVMVQWILEEDQRRCDWL